MKRKRIWYIVKRERYEEIEKENERRKINENDAERMREYLSRMILATKKIEGKKFHPIWEKQRGE